MSSVIHPQRKKNFSKKNLKQTAAFLHRTQQSYGLASEERKRRTKEGTNERRKEVGQEAGSGEVEEREGGGGGCRRLVL